MVFSWFSCKDVAFDLDTIIVIIICFVDMAFDVDKLTEEQMEMLNSMSEQYGMAEEDYTGVAEKLFWDLGFLEKLTWDLGTSTLHILGLPKMF